MDTLHSSGGGTQGGARVGSFKEQQSHAMLKGQRSVASLFHYTCAHTKARLGDRGFLLPHPQLFGRSVIWLTDMEHPNRIGLGLTSDILHCDRLDYRYITTDPAEPWMAWAARMGVDPLWRHDLETGGRLPLRWFIAERPVWVVRDRSWRK